MTTAAAMKVIYGQMPIFNQKAFGCILGAAVADSIGSYCEFSTTELAFKVL